MAPGLRRQLGLRSPVALVAGGHDQPCAAIGAGVVREGRGIISTGTAEVLATAFDRPPAAARMFESYYPCYLHAKEGMYFTFALNHVGGLLLRWYRDNIASPEVAAAKAAGRDPYAVIDERLPEGPSPLMVLPHWNGTGTPWCDIEARGAVVGWTLASTRHDLARAILEGLTYELLINLNTMEQAGIRVRQLVAAGGGAKSSRWLQLKADILNRPIQTLRCGEAACLGAAILAGAAVGAYASVDEGVRAAVAVAREYAPRREPARRYAEQFSVYTKLYPALQSLRRSK